MANFTSIHIMIGSAGPTVDVDRMIVDFDDNSQKILKKDTDVSSEPTKLKSIHSAFFN